MSFPAPSPSKPRKYTRAQRLKWVRWTLWGAAAIILLYSAAVYRPVTKLAQFRYWDEVLDKGERLTDEMRNADVRLIAVKKNAQLGVGLLALSGLVSVAGGYFSRRAPVMISGICLGVHVVLGVMAVRVEPLLGTNASILFIIMVSGALGGTVWLATLPDADAAPGARD